MEQPSIPSKAYNCDCLEYMRSLPDNYFDLAIADPPYGIGASKPSKKPSNILQKNGSIMSASVTDFGKKDWDDNIPTQEFFDELRRVSKNQIIWGANYFGLQGGMIVWDKINGNSDQYDCEIAYQSFNKRTDLVHYMWNGMFQGKYCGRDIRQAAVQQGNKTLNEKRIHPTQKPVILYEWLLNNYAKKGDRIFDPMMGSQSSRIAAYRLGFDYVGCELDKEYFDKGCNRFVVFQQTERDYSPLLLSHQDLQQDMAKVAGMVFDKANAVLTEKGLDSLNFQGVKINNGYQLYDTDEQLDFILTVRFKYFRHVAKQHRILDDVFKQYGIIMDGWISGRHGVESPDRDLLVRALAKDVRECSLRIDVMDALKERVVNPSMRTFTDEARQKIRTYTSLFDNDDERLQRVKTIKEEVCADPVVLRKPEKWFTDAAKELDYLVDGITCEEARQLTR